MMTRRLVLCFLLALLLLGAPVASAQTHTLSSSELTVRLQEAPYTFQVIDPDLTGEVLLQQHRTAFEVNGARYEVIEATNITQNGETIEATLILSGTDRTARLYVQMSAPNVVQVRLVQRDASSISEQFADHGEHYYGVWEHAFGGGIDNRGVSKPFVGNDFEHREVFAASARAPFYMTSRGVGVYAETAAPGRYHFAQSGRTGFSFDTSHLRYHIIYGPAYKSILNTYNEMAGPPVMPPTWAFGSIWWRDDHHDVPEQLQGEISNAQQLLLRDARMLQRYRIPAAAMWIDRPFTTGEWGWGGPRFDDDFSNPDQMVQTLQSEYGMRLLYWISSRTDGELKEQGLQQGYLFEEYTDRPAPDLRKEEVRRWFKGYLNELMNDAMLDENTSGIKGYKIDRGGEGEMPDSLINEQVTLFNRLAHRQMEARHGSDGFYIFARNLHDKSRRWVAHWNGDSRDNFTGLQSSIINGLRCGLMNFPTWGSDTGSYGKSPSKELFIRWLGFSAYSPMMEVLLTGRDQWFYGKDQQVIDVAADAAQAHHDLIPYTRSVLYHATQTGVPVMRAMLLEYPDDSAVTDMWNQYMYGPSLLVAPVSQQGITERSVYLPEGSWLDYSDKTTIHHGPKTVTVPAPLGTVPRFVREGVILPRGDILQTNNSWTEGWEPYLRIEVFPSADSSSRFNYYTGNEVQAITAGPDGDALRVDFGDLGHEGTVEVYAENVTEVIRNGRTLSESTYAYDDDKNVLRVPFSGAMELRLPGAESIF